MKSLTIGNINDKVLSKLLKDKTTGENIIWATNSYENLGQEYLKTNQITLHTLKGLYCVELLPRALKDLQDKKRRTKNNAEVFTPSWVCNYMNNFLDFEWFKTDNIFNFMEERTWILNEEKIPFKTPTFWQKYIYSKRLEITCGEAPYLVSRYDTTTGEMIEIPNRIGVLDRKLRVVNENTTTEEEWLKWTMRAFQSVYGYEFQGDNLLIARLNLLNTFIDYLDYMWHRPPTQKELEKMALIISWNIWQMDGLTQTIPFPNERTNYTEQLTLFDTLEPKKERIKENFCIIYNWFNKRKIMFKKIKKEGKGMKFDFIIGNPPYHVERENTSDKPIYNDFIDLVYDLGEKVELITPGRFLYNAGRTPKEWNLKMLNNQNFKILHYEQNSSKIFANTDIKGGVAISYYNCNETYDSIKHFSQFKELNSLMKKMKNVDNFVSLNTIMFPYSTYSLNEQLFKEYTDIIISKEQTSFHKLSNPKIITTNIFELLPDIFLKETQQNQNNEYIKILGISKTKRTYRYVKKTYINVADNFNKYKVILPKSNGSGAIGEVHSSPLIGCPLIGYTQSFLGIGALETKYEAKSLLKYISTKFARACLGILKITQDNPPEKWEFVPLQDFTENSDIDWSKSIAEIDQQLYKKYNLSPEEIAFIETKVKPMEDLTEEDNNEESN